MNLFFFWLYKIFIVPLLLFFIIFAFLLGHKKIRSLVRLYAKNHPTVPPGVLWIACASGEFEFVRPLIQLTKAQNPHLKILVTYTSVSYVKSILNDQNVDFALPQPLESTSHITSFLKKHQPCALIVARNTFWPALFYETGVRKIPIFFLGPMALTGLSHLASSLFFTKATQFLCFNESDLKYYKKYHKKTPVYLVPNPRIEAALEKSTYLPTIKFDDRKNIVLFGSTWEEDEKIIINTLKELKSKKTLSYILVPHEPTERRLNEIQKQLDDLDLKLNKYSEVCQKKTTWKHPVLIVDQVGVLASLYHVCDLAFVGGAFKKKVHSIIEPLVCHKKVITGPKIYNSDLAKFYKNFSVSPNKKALTCIENSDQLKELLTDIEDNKFNEIEIDKLKCSFKPHEKASEKILSQMKQSTNSLF